MILKGCLNMLWRRQGQHIEKKCDKLCYMYNNMCLVHGYNVFVLSYSDIYTLSSSKLWIQPPALGQRLQRDIASSYIVLAHIHKPK